MVLKKKSYQITGKLNCDVNTLHLGGEILLQEIISAFDNVLEQLKSCIL